MTAEPLPALLRASREGHAGAFDRAYAVVYDELRRLAHWQRRRSGPANDTFSTTALVHEAYLKLAGATALAAADRHHLIALAARAMRQILVDAARARSTAKRGGGIVTADSAAEAVAPLEMADDLLELDRALDRLAKRDERLARLVEWRYFGGMTDRELAELFDRDERTIRRDWERARSMLLRELGGEAPESS